MNQLSLHIPAINVRKMPQFSYMLNTDFEWLKFVGTGLEISRFDYQLLPRLRSQNLRAPFNPRSVSLAVQLNCTPDGLSTNLLPLPCNL